MARPIDDPRDGSGSGGTSGGGGGGGGGTSWPGVGRCPIGLTWNPAYSMCQDAAGNLYDANGVLVIPNQAQSQNGDARCRMLGMMYNAGNGYCTDGTGAWFDFNGRFISRDGVTPAPGAPGSPAINLGGLTDQLRAHPYVAAGLAIGLVYLFSRKKGY